MTATNVTPEQLANEFCRVLNAWLTPDQIAEINEMNRVVNRALVCHSHDLCDANQAMAEAMTICGMESDLIDTRDRQLINAAWSVAKGRGFAVV